MATAADVRKFALTLDGVSEADHSVRRSVTSAITLRSCTTIA